jgi:hypothetical protein
LIGIVLTPAAGTANRRKGVRRGFISALLFSCLFVVGCSGGGAVNPNGTTFTPTGTYAMTITATSSANSQEVTQTLPITLIVQ